MAQGTADGHVRGLPLAHALIPSSMQPMCPPEVRCHRCCSGCADKDHTNVAQEASSSEHISVNGKHAHHGAVTCLVQVTPPPGVSAATVVVSAAADGDVAVWSVAATELGQLLLHVHPHAAPVRLPGCLLVNAVCGWCCWVEGVCSCGGGVGHSNACVK